MTASWCIDCCTQHSDRAPCPGELPATGEEQSGWRVNVESAEGIEAYGVLVAPSYEVWRARIMTFPNILWSVPGGNRTMKFVGASAEDAQAKAVRFLREHCHARGILMRDEIAQLAETAAGPADVGRAAVATERPARDPSQEPAQRKIRFLPVRFGVVSATERAGTGNLSTTGIFIITETPVEQGRKLEMLLGTGADRVPLQGVVRWMRTGHHVGRAPGMGVELHQPPPTYLKFVDRLS